jgi:hypothetical protein
LVLVLAAGLGAFYQYRNYKLSLPAGNELVVEKGDDVVFGAITLGNFRLKNIKFQGFEYKDGQAYLRFEYLKNRKAHNLEVRSTISFDVVERKYYEMGKHQIDLLKNENVILSCSVRLPA